MKFAKELEDDLVPEWRAKYINYKLGKKKIKALSKALQNVNRTPAPPGRPALEANTSTDRLPFTYYDFNDPSRPDTAATVATEGNGGANGDANIHDNRQSLSRRESLTMFAKSPPMAVPAREEEEGIDSPDSSAENTPLQSGRNFDRTGSYGSIVASPSAQSPERMKPLELPDPALTPVQSRMQQPTANNGKGSTPPQSQGKPPPSSPDPYHIGQPKTPPYRGGSLPKRLFGRRNHPSHPTPKDKPRTFPRSRLRRMFTAQQLDTPKVNDIQLEAYKELDTKQDEFFSFLDKELDKIEEFYKAKEEEANERLDMLRKQLHELRDQRLHDIERAKRGERVEGENGILDGILPITPLPNMPVKDNSMTDTNGGHSYKPFSDMLQGKPKIGKTSKTMQELCSPPGTPGTPGKQKPDDSNKDYVRRKRENDHVPYRFAKRRLKLALQEYYRGLELLKSYVLLNRTGFRKINKKYDKAVNARPPGRYVAEKISSAYFVKSDVIDGHLVAVEDLYARYFERGHRKIAVSKLRSKLRKGDQSSTTFRNGLYIAAGTCFGITGVINGMHRLFDPDPALSTPTSYLLQIYAAYFLALLLFLLFVIDCRIWAANRINYTFVFEYDTRNTLDWRQLAELPCIFLFLNGLIMNLNFQQTNHDKFYIYWPILLIVITLIMLALPLKILYYHAREWFAFSNWRLLLAGLYPVEFRDFFLGDMFCSLTYTMGQIELFFCLYANSWNNPSQCNSSNSRLLGFLTTLPAIWRAFQCLRRYYDSRNWFPHLANFAKYCCNILYYMSLSMYRMNMSGHMKAMFIVFAAVNGVYCSFWDVFMDFSLGNGYSKHWLLRDYLAFKSVWVYYVAIIADVILRQQWIFYAIFSEDLQHSAAMSFAVGLAEVLRRGMWSLFRVENEHCNNVGQFRASRDIALPYKLEGSSDSKKKKISSPEEQEEGEEERSSGEDQNQAQSATGVDLERASSAAESVRRRAAASSAPGMGVLKRVATVIASAHLQDFEKKRRPDVVGQTAEDQAMGHGNSSEDDDDEEDDEDEDDEQVENEDEREISNQDVHQASKLVDRAHLGAGL